METVILRAPAKVNLVLSVSPERDATGYHRVRTVLAALDFADRVTCAPSDAPELSCSAAIPVPCDENLAWRALMAMADAFGREPNVRIRLEKRIPMQAGLGGGSSDAAAVIRGVAGLWGIGADDPELVRVAANLGADVPFFLGPSCAILGGRGDALERALPRPECSAVLVRAEGAGVSTAAAYRAFDAYAVEPGFRPASCEAMVEALEGASTRAIAASLANDLERAAVTLDPTVAEALGWLRGQPEVFGAQVAGSGSAVFGLVASADGAQRLAEAAAAAGYWSQATAFV